jgi:uncharacterized protein (TIGR03032 family)
MTPTVAPQTAIECSADEGFSAWLCQSGGCLAISTYQAGKVCMIGWNGRQVTMLPRDFEKPMGLAVDDRRLAIACRYHVHLLANDPRLAHDYVSGQPGRYEGLYLPRASYFTGELNIHDVAYGADNLWLVATRFSCLAGLSQDFGFVPKWKPSFVSDIVPEDRCHLNGLAMRDRKPAFVTALGESDVVGGWRDGKSGGGIIMDIESNEVVHRGLSMPHSPRWHADHLWVLNSGCGELTRLDLTSGKTDVIATLQGYLRGLCFVDDYAVVGLCQIRERHIFGGLPIQQRFKKLLCAVAVVELSTGNCIGLLEFTSGCEELYDIQFLPSLRHTSILNPRKEAIHQAVTAPDCSYWLRPDAEIRTAAGQGRTSGGSHLGRL